MMMVMRRSRILLNFRNIRQKDFVISLHVFIARDYHCCADKSVSSK